MASRWDAPGERQRKFIDIYLSNGNNGKDAALKSGYSKRTAASIASKLLHREGIVKTEIARVKAKAAAKSEITAVWILNSLKEIADACKAPNIEAVRMPDGEVKIMNRGVVDSAGANRSLELLGKNQRLWLDSLEVVRRTEFADLSDEELLGLIKQSAKQHKE